MILSDYATYLTLTIPIVYSPGPMAMFILSNGIAAGFRRTLPALFGASTSYLIGILIFAGGLASLLQKKTNTLFVIQLLGILYILYLAYRQLAADNINTSEITTHSMPKKNIDSFTLFKKGFLTAFLNPKTILLFSIILPQFVTNYKTKITDITILGATFLILQFSSGCLYGYFGHKIQYALQSPSRQKLIRQISAATLFLVASLLLFHLVK